MAFLGKGLKADFQIMATEMGVEDVLSLKVFELREAILNSKNFDEEFCREQLNTNIEERKRREEMDLAERKRKEEIDLAGRKRKEDIEFSERKRKEEIEFAERKRLDELEERKRKDEMNFELQKKRIELGGGGGSENEVKESGQFNSLHQLEGRDVRNKDGMGNCRYNNHFNDNSHQARYNQTHITPRCYTCGKEGHSSRACRDKNLNKQDSPKNKFSSPLKAQSNAVQAEDTTKNIVTEKIDASESTCNFLAENIDKLKVIKVKCLDVVLDGTVDSGAQISVMRADLVKDIECTGEGKIKLISAFGDSEVAPLRTFNIKIDDGWHDAIPITCAVSKKLVNDMLVCQTAYEALLESIQLCSVNARQVIEVGVQMDEVRDSTVYEVPTCEESSYSDIEVSTDAVNIENEVRSNLSIYGRLPSGPMTILKEFWKGEREIPTGAARSVEEYLKQLQKKLQDAHEIKSENSAKNQERMTSHYYLRSREKSFSVGDEVLILMPSSTHKLLNTWIGPAKVVKLSRPHSCLVRMEDGNTRELHVNKLRPYISRVDHVGIIFDQDTDFGELHYAPTDKENQPNINIELNQMPDVLNAQQKYQLRNLLQRYEDIFRNRPGKARVKGHSVKVTADCSPKRLQPYRVPIALQKEVERQINELQDMDLIEHSDSDWVHPVEYDVHFYAWIDFQVVLYWLSSHPRNWKPYIANITSKTFYLVPANSWRYVPTKMNPADMACRGLSPKELPTCFYVVGRPSMAFL
ncbi:retrovirus-related Pol polyprotein from transposon opus [Trichonephila clavata]|uniref:Retrovirus-related Pol polyprotein from transposon opus n=1 Tax=Trichonephila clavata TaxID=2740835 RepID=A0A8X6HRE8_TRICU|nr:retrovirus-related Pol polyprotein from transposon opus [Trichonephila clavata]